MLIRLMNMLVDRANPKGCYYYRKMYINCTKPRRGWHAKPPLTYIMHGTFHQVCIQVVFAVDYDERFLFEWYDSLSSCFTPSGFSTRIHWSSYNHFIPSGLTCQMTLIILACFSSDLTGTYAVMVQGITANGLCGSGTVFFIVQQEKQE